jgi:two-component system cell cycle response regulator DivK
MNVLEAKDGKEGLEQALAHHPDLILMDLNLPGKDGYDLTKEFKAMPELADIPIVALTANVMGIHREKIARAGCDGFISKPINVDKLPTQVRQFLKHT